MKLVIANKTYSSWSMRPWLLLRAFEIGFDEVVIPLDQPGTASAIAPYSPTGKLPVLIDGTIRVWESLAIIDYLAEAYGQHPIWPENKAARAMARALAAEMHAGFGALRRALPMNMRRTPAPLALAASEEQAVAADIRRLESAWADARQEFGGGGAFLFGAFCAADAMFAPVVNRLEVYGRAVSDETRAYMDAMRALPAWRDWRVGAEAEGWSIARLERP